jgi:hypothetical protein
MKVEATPSTFIPTWNHSKNEFRIPETIQERRLKRRKAIDRKTICV